MVALWQQCDLTRPWNDPYKDIGLVRKTSTSTVLVGKQLGTVIASAMVGFEGHRGWVYYVGVAPRVQMQGYGRQIMAAAEEWLRARGAPKIHLTIRSENIGVAAFYESLGYADQKFRVMGKRL